MFKFLDWFFWNIVLGIGSLLFVLFVEGYIGVYLILMNHIADLPPAVIAHIPFDVECLTSYLIRVPAFWACGWICVFPFGMFCGWFTSCVTWDPWLHRPRFRWL